MAYRWYLCPVTNLVIIDPVEGPIDKGRYPLAGTLVEPGRNKFYQFNAAIDAPNWCLALVKATDWTELDANENSALPAAQKCINIFEGSFNIVRWLVNNYDDTLRSLGINAARATRIRNRLDARGVDTTGLTLDSTVGDVLDRCLARIAAYYRVRNMSF